jgi:shikimate dehydrogenase
MARRNEQAQDLREQLSVVDKQITVLPPPHSSLNPDPYTLIVNTTPVGMHPHENASPWPKNIPFPENAIIYDLVYNPRETLLVKQARSAGLPAFTGIGMLIEQAALAFERWTGLEAPRKTMRQAVGG